MNGFPILSIVTLFPAAGALLILAVRSVLPANENPGFDKGVRQLTLVFTLATFVASLFMFAAFDPTKTAMQFAEHVTWVRFGNIELAYSLGVDSLAMSLIMLTTFLTPLCILASWHIEKQVTSYMVLFLLLETLMIGVFCATDIVVFYLFFEGGLIPMFILIGVWGGDRRVYAAFKFFLYTLLGSLLMLVAILVMASMAGTTNIQALQQYHFDPNLQIWLWLAFFASFAVKLPMWPVHTWLPDAHVEAPSAASVVLAAILLKMGGYGFLRFSLPMFPDASHFFTPMMFALSVVAIIYASLTAFRQLDMKKLIAYSSVAHMGFVTLGMFAGTEQGIQGSIFQMISHGVISGALFLCVGVVYDRMHTREIAFYGGVVNRMPVYAAIFMLFTLGNVGLPGTSGFPGEILTMVGAFPVSPWFVAAAATGVIFSASYALTLYRKVALGPIVNPKLDHLIDLDAREWATFVPLIIATLIMGLAPNLVLDFTHSSAEAIARAYVGGVP